MNGLSFQFKYILYSGMASHAIIDQSMNSICDVKKILGGEAKWNSLDSTYTCTYTVMLIYYLISIDQLDIVIKFTCCHWSLLTLKLITWIKLRPLSALSLDEGLNALSGKNPSGCWLVQPTNQMSDISA